MKTINPTMNQQTIRMGVPFGRLGIILVCVLIMSGCQNPVTVDEIMSSDPVRQARAIKLASNNKDISAMPHLVDLLENEDSGMQTLAITALRNISGENFGYDVWAGPLKKREAQLKWKQYMEQYENNTPSDNTE